MVDFKKLKEEAQMKRGYCFLPEPDNTKPIKGIRTSCVTGEEREVDLRYEIKPCPYANQHDTRFVFHLDGGPTGYESFTIDEYIADVTCGIRRGWTACAGTKGRWDKLFIPGEEMRRVFMEHLEKEMPQYHDSRIVPMYLVVMARAVMLAENEEKGEGGTTT